MTYIAIAIVLWAVALLPVATTIGRIPHTDRDCDSEETEREPIREGQGEIHVLHINPYRLNQEQDHG